MKTWFVTGGTRGFGAAVAKEALARGDRVAITGRDKAACDALAAGHGDRALALKLDMLEPHDIPAAVAAVLDWAPAVDVLFNNAGRGQHGAIEECSDEEVKEVFEINVFGLLDLTRRLLPSMRAAGRGHVINVGSVAGLAGNPGSGIYSATKFAIEGISEALHGELAPLGIHVTILEPGPFRTDFNGSSIVRAETRIAAYADTAHKRIESLTAGSGKQAGDPGKLARMVCDIAEMSDPPLHLPAGNAAFDRTMQKLSRMRAEIAEWEETIRALDH